MSRARAAPGALLLLPALSLGLPAAVAFVDGPPPAHTGGFDEPTCGACHFDVETPDPAGSVTLTGLPDAYAPGARYLLRLRVHRPGMGAAGFEMAARVAEGGDAGGQAGTLQAADPGVAVVRDKGIDYAHQNGPGTRADSPGQRTWALEWTAPDAPLGPVVFHFVGNAADGDESQFGDHVYSGSVTLAPAGGARLSAPQASARPPRSAAAAGSPRAAADRSRSP